MTVTASIGEFAQINPRIPKELLARPNRIVHFVPMSELSEQGCIQSNGARRLKDVVKGYTYFENGDVLVAKITPCMENGKAAFVDGLEHDVAFGSTEFHVLRPNPELDGKYLFYMIWNPEFRHVAESRMTGSAGQKRVPKSFLERFEIPLPKLTEQKRITAILDKAYSIRRQREEAADTLLELRIATFLDFFGDPETNPKNWNKLRLGDVTKLQGGYAFKSKDYVSEGVSLVKISNVHHEVLKWEDESSVPLRFEEQYSEFSLKVGDVVHRPMVVQHGRMHFDRSVWQCAFRRLV